MHFDGNESERREVFEKIFFLRRNFEKIEGNRRFCVLFRDFVCGGRFQTSDIQRVDPSLDVLKFRKFTDF